MTSALEYWPSPPPWGWTADDLDRLPSDGPNGEPDFFKHVELIDGALVFMSPQKLFHECVINGLRQSLNDQAPPDLVARTQMDVKLDPRTRVCPDVVLIPKTAVSDLNRTFFEPGEVSLVIEVVSPESEQRDRNSKPGRYAAASIHHFWRVEDNDGKPVIYVYQLDQVTKTYAVTGIHHGKLNVPVPFEIAIDLDALAQ